MLAGSASKTDLYETELLETVADSDASFLHVWIFNSTK